MQNSLLDLSLFPFIEKTKKIFKRMRHEADLGFFSFAFDFSFRGGSRAFAAL
jgi:hypothetical protein